MCHCWASNEQTPQGVILLVHGLGGHGLRYAEWAQKFASVRCVVFAIDLRGHGQSEGLRGDVQALGDFISDIATLVEYINQSEYAKLPKFIYGNSMGGLLSVLYLHTHNNVFKGGILSAPWFKLTNPPPALFVHLLKWLAKIMPKYKLKTGVSSHQLRSSSLEQEKARKDTYVHRFITIRLLHLLNGQSQELCKNIPLLNLPIFCVHGKNDPVTDVAQTIAFAKAQGSLCELLLLDKAKHEIHLEEESTLVFHKLIIWIKQQINV